VAEIDLVEVALEELVLGVLPLQLGCVEHLFEFAEDGAL
jgi:hypothetical protein